MKMDFDLVLNDFTLNTLGATTEQVKLNDYIAWLMTTANNAQENPDQSPEKSLAIKQNIDALFERYGVASDIINKRYVLPITNMLKHDKAENENYSLPSLFKNVLTEPEGDNISDRTQYFQDIVIRYFEQCYENTTKAPDEIIHVTSMGWILPSPLQRFLSTRGWNSTQVTHSYFYGCLGSIPALRNAAGGLLSAWHELTSPKESIDIVHTEFLTIHMGSLDLSPDNIICATLFSDGFAKYSMHRSPHHNPTVTKGLKVLGIYEKLMGNSSDDMVWTPGPHQFSLYLSIGIPRVIGKNILEYVNELCRKSGIDFQTEKDNLIYAIHPGGESILEIIQRRLELRDEQIQASRQLLYDCGNISSASLPYLWDQILNSDEIKSKTKILTLSFGPGMTAAGAILEKL